MSDFLKRLEMIKIAVELGDEDVISLQARRLPPEVGELSALLGEGEYELAVRWIEKYCQTNPISTAHEGEEDSWVQELIAWADKNKISEEDLPRNKEELLNLTMLTLSERNLSDLPESIGNLKNLHCLDLSNNNLSCLPDSIGSLKNLSDLDLTNNNLDCLPMSFGGLYHSLNMAWLDGNPIEELPTGLGHMLDKTDLYHRPDDWHL